MIESVEAMLIFQSASFAAISSYSAAEANVLTYDFDHNRSLILDAIDRLLQSSVGIQASKSHPDTKMLSLALHFYSNILVNGPSYCLKVIHETQLVSIII